MFTCPICGNHSCTVLSFLSELLKCDKCSVIFDDPVKFGSVDTKQKEQNKVTDSIRTYPHIPGVVISEPVKLRRL